MNNDRVYYSHDAEMQARHERTMLTILCLTLGLGIGAALAILFAPMSGKKARAELGKVVEQGWNNGREAVDPLVKRVEKEFGELQKNVEDKLK